MRRYHHTKFYAIADGANSPLFKNNDNEVDIPLTNGAAITKLPVANVERFVKNLGVSALLAAPSVIAPNSVSNKPDEMMRDWKNMRTSLEPLMICRREGVFTT